jgi:hypothetical protein
MTLSKLYKITNSLKLQLLLLLFKKKKRVLWDFPTLILDLKKNPMEG